MRNSELIQNKVQSITDKYVKMHNTKYATCKSMWKTTSCGCHIMLIKLHIILINDDKPTIIEHSALYQVIKQTLSVRNWLIFLIGTVIHLNNNNID